jgi:hypothetical protein
MRSDELIDHAGGNRRRETMDFNFAGDPTKCPNCDKPHQIAARDTHTLHWCHSCLAAEYEREEATEISVDLDYGYWLDQDDADRYYCDGPNPPAPFADLDFSIWTRN